MLKPTLSLLSYYSCSPWQHAIQSTVFWCSNKKNRPKQGLKSMDQRMWAMLTERSICFQLPTTHITPLSGTKQFSIFPQLPNPSLKLPNHFGCIVLKKSKKIKKNPHLLGTTLTLKRPTTVSIQDHPRTNAQKLLQHSMILDPHQHFTLLCFCSFTEPLQPLLFRLHLRLFISQWSYTLTHTVQHKHSADLVQGFLGREEYMLLALTGARPLMGGGWANSYSDPAFVMSTDYASEYLFHPFPATHFLG